MGNEKIEKTTTFIPFKICWEKTHLVIFFIFLLFCLGNLGIQAVSARLSAQPFLGVTDQYDPNLTTPGD